MRGRKRGKVSFAMKQGIEIFKGSNLFYSKACIEQGILL